MNPEHDHREHDPLTGPKAMLAGLIIAALISVAVFVRVACLVGGAG